MVNNFKVPFIIPALVVGMTILGFSSKVEAAQESRNGIYGGITYVEVCNVEGMARTRVKLNAVSNSRRVSRVEIKQSSRFRSGAGWFQIVSGEGWRDLSKGTFYNWFSDRKYYDTGALFAVGSTYMEDAPIKYSIHVIDTNGRRTIDLGGIVDLGRVPVGRCASWGKQ
jgi:hypothetical protein